MTKRLFAIILLVLFSSNAFACALCAAYTPTTHISVNFKANEGKIESIVFEWTFSQEFSDALLQNYDINANNKIDENEFEPIKEALLVYVLPRKQLTQIFLQDNDTLKPQEFTLKDYEVFMKDDILAYRYELGVSINPNERFGIRVQDEGDFFAFFFLQPQPFAVENGYLVGNLNANTIVFGKVENNATQANLGTQTNAKTQESQNTGFWDEILQKAIALNAKFTALIKAYISGDGGFVGILTLMALSFIYGVFHASAPGHAKLLTSSYFLTHKSSYIKAFSFALKVGVVHILSAFLLVSIALVVLKMLVQSLANNANVIITQISSVLIMLVALFLLSKKILKPHSKDCSCAVCKGEFHSNLAPQNAKNVNFRSMRFKRVNFSELAIIIAAGIVPCPTMVLVFLLAYEVSFATALLSAVCIALGMSLVVFLAAIIAHKVHLSAKTQRISTLLEYGALIFMLLLGAFIFFNAKSGVF